MKPVWRRMRLWATLFTAVIGIGLLVLALSAPDTVRGEARVLLVFTGIVLPLGFHAVFTLVGWQNSADSGTVPPPLVARSLKWHGAQIAPVVFMLFLVGLLQQMSSALDRKPQRESAASVAEDNYRFVRDSCVTENAAAVRKDGGDPESTEIKLRIAKYCGCMAVNLPLKFTPEEFQLVSAGRAPASQSQKFQGIVERCQAESGAF